MVHTKIRTNKKICHTIETHFMGKTILVATIIGQQGENIALDVCLIMLLFVSCVSEVTAQCHIHILT